MPGEMTARQALEAANALPEGERLKSFERRCGSLGSCRSEPCERDAGRWSFCPDCLTVFDDYGKPVNPIPEFRTMKRNAERRQHHASPVRCAAETSSAT